MAYVLSGKSETNLSVYLTEIGKKRFLTGNNFKIIQFGLGDSDVNYLNSEVIPFGEIPDLTGTNEECLNSVFGNGYIRNFINKDPIEKPKANLINFESLDSLGNSDCPFKLVFTEILTKRVTFNFNIQIILENPSFYGILSYIEYKDNRYTINEFNNLDFVLNIGEFETDFFNFVFSNELLDTTIKKEIIILVDIVPNNSFELLNTKTLRRYNNEQIKPKILNVTPIQNQDGNYNFFVELENLSYSLPLSYSVFGFNQLDKDIVNTTSHTLTNILRLGYNSGTYTIIVKDSLGNEDIYTVTTKPLLTAVLSIPSPNKFQIIVNGGSNNFFYSIYKTVDSVVQPLLIHEGNVISSNTVVVDNIDPITNGTYYAIIKDDAQRVNSNNLVYTSSTALPNIELIEQTYNNVKIKATNVSALGNHLLLIKQSFDDITYFDNRAKSANFINQYTFSDTLTTQNKVYYKKYKLQTSYGVESNELKITIQPATDLGDEILLPTNPDIGCFAPNTLVTMDNNTTKQIKDILVGDRLKSFKIKNFTNSDDFNIYSKWNDTKLDMTEDIAIVTSKITKTISYHYIINNDLKCSYDHTFLVERNGVFMFLKAKDIKNKDYLISKNGTKTIVNYIIRKNVPIEVISIDVNNTNLYIVNNIITHNKRTDDNTTPTFGLRAI